MDGLMELKLSEARLRKVTLREGKVSTLAVLMIEVDAQQVNLRQTIEMIGPNLAVQLNLEQLPMFAPGTIGGPQMTLTTPDEWAKR